MHRIEEFFDRWKTDYDFKTVAAAFGSLAVTAVFALYNGFLGVYHASLWHGTICVYYLVLVILRGVIISARKRTARERDPKQFQKKVYIASAALLLLLNICLVIPVSLMVIRQKPVNMSLIPAIAMAAYTTYKITMASVHLKRRKRSSGLLTTRTSPALISILPPSPLPSSTLTSTTARMPRMLSTLTTRKTAPSTLTALPPVITSVAARPLSST